MSKEEQQRATEARAKEDAKRLKETQAAQSKAKNMANTRFQKRQSYAANVRTASLSFHTTGMSELQVLVTDQQTFIMIHF